MTRDPFGQSMRRAERDGQLALNELKRHPDYPAIQLRAMEESESLFKSVGSLLPKPALPSQERLDCAIRSMDIWAGAYAALITNLPDQEKYLKILNSLQFHAWKVYIGITRIEPLPYNQAWVAIRDRVFHWQKESLRRLVASEAPQDSINVVGAPAGFEIAFEEPGQTGAASRAETEQAKNDPDKFASEAARTSALADYINRWTCSEAALARTATVDPADLSKWKKGSLPAGSEKKTRIENALRNNEAATTTTTRPKKFSAVAGPLKNRQRWPRNSPMRQD
jgi:hypothetical protein